jgi:hypothetical protein
MKFSALVAKILLWGNRHACRFLGAIFCYFHIHAEETTFDPFVSSLTNTQTFLPTTIHSISAISGEWLESETDLVLQGAEPLSLTRCYSPGYSSGKLGFNWEFNRPQSLVVHSCHYFSESKNTLRARLHHPSGVKTIHEQEQNRHSSVHILPLARTKALTNCRSADLSAKTNLHNVSLKIDTKKKIGEVLTGSGHLIRYELKKEDIYESMYFEPEYERKSNGNLIRFKSNEIMGQSPDGSVQYGSLHFKKVSEEELKVIGSDETIATYYFDCYQSQKPPLSLDPASPLSGIKNPIESKKYCLKKVCPSRKPAIEYEYDYPPHEDPQTPPPNPFLKKKSLPDGRFQEVSYYKAGINHLKIVEKRILA